MIRPPPRTAAGRAPRREPCSAISVGCDALVGGVDEAERLLDADQHDLGLREGLGEDVAQRDRAALTLDDQLAAVRVPHGAAHRLVAGPAQRSRRTARRRLRARTRPGRATVPPTRDGRSARPVPASASMPGGTRRLIRARASGWMAADEPTTGGQSMPSTVAAGRAQIMSATASPSRSTPSRTFASLRNCSGGYATPPRSGSSSSPLDRRVAVLVPQGGQHGDQRGEGVGRRPAEHAGVHRAGQRVAR